MSLDFQLHLRASRWFETRADADADAAMDARRRIVRESSVVTRDSAMGVVDARGIVTDGCSWFSFATAQSFGDVDALLMNYFTFRALKETLAQMQETDLSPGKGEYKWLYNFAAAEYQNRGDEFIQKLFKEGRGDHAQRILAQRVVLLKRWTSYFNRGRGSDKCYEKFESKNLELLREQLFCTVNLSEDALATKECDEPTLYRKIIEDAEQDESDAA